ncbi:putative membrane protein [Proteiniphilum saccharofermentans]|uniref:Putative membrane protein n=1 Tax=Proteiniphilum saccharofermentans TaxID=1642647 RepID=A0A1R3T4F0_9BACT|nr:hypothetical protein [Proteiniphilum saccharofermentans]SCD20939.1 putative membrane protein [Proteiniphilum saccharofermentans]
MLISGIVLIVSGILAVPPRVLPAKWIDLILRYRACFSIICLIFGVWELIIYIQNIFTDNNLFIGIVGLLFSIAKINMGIILGYKLMEKQILKWNNKKTVDGLYKRNVDFILFKTNMSFIVIGLGVCQVLIAFFR